MPRLALLALLLLGACAHRVRVESDPPGATVKVRKKSKGPAPQELRFLWLPFRQLNFSVSAPGYRTVVVQASDYAGFGVFTRELLSLRFGRLSGVKPRATIQVVLVREHGPAGTWTEEEVR